MPSNLKIDQARLRWRYAKQQRGVLARHSIPYRPMNLESLLNRRRNPAARAASRPSLGIPVCGVLGTCANKKVARVGAYWIVASMADRMPRRNFPSCEELVGIPMGSSGDEFGVTVLVFRPRPSPTCVSVLRDDELHHKAPMPRSSPPTSGSLFARYELSCSHVYDLGGNDGQSQ